MPSNVLIDTNIWHFAFVSPREERFEDIHTKAGGVLEEILSNRGVRIVLSAYQVGEILEILRRSGVDPEIREGLLKDFKSGKFFVKDLTWSVAESAIADSSKSNIHVYDYLVAYPVKGLIDRIYSADDHFLHEHFAFAEVVNPVAPWVLREGIKPFKQD
ncbi:MAG: type II toxin-antitoxin system VapC family toxin [Methanobacteriota archaeon]|nr:MAG: type II toxin-antitoxin system VapC family toxin [Euryarchaeota archaeon]